MDKDAVYAAPVEDRAADEDVAAVALDHRRVVLLHLAAWACLGLLTAVTAAVLAAELSSPDTGPNYAATLTLHSGAGFAVLLAPVAGIAGVLLLPSRLQRPGFRWQWLGYISLAVWPLSVALLVLGPSQIPLESRFLFFAALVSGLAALAAMILVEIAAGRAHWKDAPLLVFGVGLGSVLQLLAFGRSTIQFLGVQFGFATFGSGLDFLLPLTFPVALGIGADILARARAEPLPRILSMVVIAALAVAPWLPGEARVVGAPVGVFALVAGPLVWFNGKGRGEPRAVAAVAAIVFASMAAIVTPAMLFLDPDNLDDPYVMTGEAHLASAAALFVLLAAILDQPWTIVRRGASRNLALVGIVLSAAGFAALSFDDVVLGHRAALSGGIVCAGFFVLVAAFVKGR